MSLDILSAIRDPKRLSALRALGLLDTPAEAAFDRLARLATRLLQAPIALVSLVDEDRQFFKSCLGLPEPWASWRATPLSHSFCQHVVAAGAPLVICDARDHPEFCDNLAIRDLRVIAYLGVPLTVPTGHTIGSFCVFDSKPRTWTELEIDTVRDFAASVMSEIELHVMQKRLKKRNQEQAGRLGASHAEVQAAQKKIVEVFERITDGFVALDRDWRYTYINRRGAEFFGRRPEDLIGKHIWTEFPEGMGQPFQLAYERAMTAQVPIQIEEYYAPWDRWFENRIYPSPEGISIFYQEITERKRSEAKLQENERRLRIALNAGHMGIFDWDVVNNVIVWSEEHARLFGMRLEDFDGRYETFAARVHPQDFPRINRAVETARANQSFYKEEFRVVWPDGTLHWIAGQGQFFYDGAQQAVRMSGVVRGIDARKDAEEALRASEERLRLAVDAAHLGTFDWDIPNNRITWSRWHEELWGFKPGEFSGTYETFSERLHPEDAPGIDAEVARCMAAREPLAHEFRVVWPDGSTHWIACRGEFTFGADGQPLRMHGVVREISARKRAELLLSSEKRVLEMMAEGVPLRTILETITRNVEAESNDTLCSILLLDAEGIHLQHGAAPSLPEGYNRAVHGAAIGPKAGSCGTAVYRNQAVIVTDIATDPLWNDYRALALPHGLRACWSMPIRSANGQVLGSFAMYYRAPRAPNPADFELIARVTHLSAIAIEHRRAEEALKQSEQRLRGLIDGLGPYMFVGLLTPEGIVVDVNRPALAGVGLKPEDVLGKSLPETYTWNYSEKIQQQLRAAITRAAHGEGSRYDVQVRATENQFIIIDFSLQPLRDETGKIIFLIPSGNVITERKQAEDGLRQLTHELEQRVAERTAALAETNAELEAFSYTVSHDLRAPLRAVQGLAQALREDYADKLDALGQEYAQRLVAAAERMDGLIQDLLAYSRLTRTALKSESVELHAIVTHACEQLASDIAQSGARINIKKPLPAVSAHPATLAQVVTNLVANAIKFVAPSQRPEVEIRAERRGDSVRLWVQDNGIGIEVEHQERIFRVFERLHGVETYPGTGIGLAIVRKGVERMGGSTGVESAPAQGSRFWIDLPISKRHSHK